MQTMKIIVCFILGFFLFSCAEDKKSESSETSIEVDTESNETVFFESIFEDVDYVRLEARKDCILTTTGRVIFFNNEFYIADIGLHHCILVFDEHGRYKRKIGVRGNGNGEYKSLYDFTIDKERERLVILSANSSVYCYDLDGKFLWMKDLDGFAMLWNIASCKGGYFLTTNNFTYSKDEEIFLIFCYDKDFNLQGRVVSASPVQLSMHGADSEVLSFYIHEGRTMLSLHDLKGNSLLEGYYMGLIPKLTLYDDGDIYCLAESSFVQDFMAERAAIQGKAFKTAPDSVVMGLSSCILRFKIKKDFRHV